MTHIIHIEYIHSSRSAHPLVRVAADATITVVLILTLARRGRPPACRMAGYGNFGA